MIACPDCWAARTARAEVLADGFWAHLGATLLVFALVALAAWLIVRRLDAADGRA